MTRARRFRAPLVIAIITLLAAGAAGAAGATGSSRITFDEHSSGTVVDTEYAAQGVRFGKAGDFGVTLSGARNCGAPTVFVPTSDGPPPHYARTPVCSGSSGTVAAFTHARKSISVIFPARPSSFEVVVRAYDRSGGLLEQRFGSSAVSTLSLERDKPEIAYLALDVAGETDTGAMFDDLVFDHLGDPLTISGRNVAATVGVERTDNVARLVDADPTAAASDYRATIEWGDGSRTDGRLSQSGDGFDVIGTHTYASVGSYTIATTVEKVNGVRATTTSAATVTSAPSFSLSVEPPSTTVDQGGKAVYRVTVTPQAGFSGTVTLGLEGATGTFAPASVTTAGTATLTISTSNATRPGTYPLRVTGRSGTLTASSTAELVVRVPAAPVKAIFSPAGKAKALGMTLLNAKGSIATRLRWDLNGDGRDDVECGGSDPVLGVRMLGSGVRSVRLTSVAADGRSAVTKRAVSVSGRPSSGRVAASLPQVAFCGDTPTVLDPKGRLCAERVVFGTIDARGCLKRVTRPSDVPAAEKPVLQELVAAYNTNPQLRRYVFEFCLEVNGGGCRRTERTIDLKETRPVLEALDFLASASVVRVNGLHFRPLRGASIVLFPQLGRLVSSNAEISIDGIVLRKSGTLNLDVEGNGPLHSSIFGAKRRVTLGLGELTLDQAIPTIGGFLPVGTGEVTLVRGAGVERYSETTARLQLPFPFTLLSGPRPTGETTLRADNDRGVDLDRLTVAVPDAFVGPVRFANVKFAYSASGDPRGDCRRHWWQATASIFLGSVDTGSNAGIRLAPPPDLNGIAFCNGRFRSAGGEVVFGAQIPPPQLFPGVFLNSINFGLRLDPTLVRGGATISAAQVSNVKGTMITVYPSPAAPYVLTRSDAGPELAALAGRRFERTSLMVGGAYAFKVPGLPEPIQFGNGYFLYSYPDYIALGGSMRLLSPLMLLTGGLDGEVAVGRGLFTFHGRVNAEIDALGTFGVDAWLTSTGVVACGSFGGLHPGAGYRWGDSLPEVWLVDGCKPSPYWVTVTPSALTADSALSRAGSEAANATSFVVRPGERTKNIRLRGAGGAPRIEVIAPGGERISTAQRDFAVGTTLAVLRQQKGRVTWVGVRNAKPGTYTVQLLPGSAAIAETAGTRPGSTSVVKASVAGRGSSRTLRYDVGRVVGQTVTFVERGNGVYRRLGRVAQGRGTIRFSPAPGRAATRQIVAEVTVRGVPTPTRVVARFKVKSAPRLGVPRALTVRRRGARLAVSWKRVPGATAYAVVVTANDGGRRLIRVPGRRSRLVVTGVAVTQGGSVTIRALGSLGERGRARSATFPARRAAPSRFLPFRELGAKHGR